MKILIATKTKNRINWFKIEVDRIRTWRVGDKLYEPSSGLIWSANNRVVLGSFFWKIV